MTDFLKARTDVKSVFGKYSIPKDDVKVDGKGLEDASIYDYLVRNGGKESIQARIQKSDKSTSAVATPLTYLDDKKKDLIAMVEILKTSAETTFARYLNRNMTVKEAREKTRKDLDTKFMQLMKDHEEDFSKTDTSRAIKKLTGN